MIRLTRDRIAKDMEACIDMCTDCHDACLELIDHCLQQGGRQADHDHIKLLEDCAEICQTSMNFMLRESGRHVLTCAVTAAMCEEAARYCASYRDDEVMMRCADICRRTARACRGMAWKLPRV